MHESDTIVLTPTRWKWVLGGVVCLIVPVIGVFLFVFCLVAGFGGGRSLTLRRDGFELRNWGASKAYDWDEVSQFEARTAHYFFVALWSSVVFTPIAKKGKLIMQASKLISGGSDKIPAIGMNARELAGLMNQYRAAYVGGGARADDRIGIWGDAQNSSPWGEPDASARTPAPRVSHKLAQESIPHEAKNTPSKAKDIYLKAHTPMLTKKDKRAQKQDPLVQDSARRKWWSRD